MCHLILALPFVALPMLWFLPWSVGIPLYGVVLALSIATYVMVFKAMRRPITAGPETLIHEIGTVRSVDQRTVRVSVASEQWAATCSEGPLTVGGTIEVIGREGLTLHVRVLTKAATHTIKQKSLDHEE